MYKQAQVGEYWADFLVDGKIILEIEATTAIIAEHQAQALHYLTATGLRLALLINFGTRSLRFKRIIRQAFKIRVICVIRCVLVF
jgi:GxxExxY protein